MKKLILVLAAVFFCCATISAKPKVDSAAEATIRQCAKLTQPLLPMEVDKVTFLWGISNTEDSLIYYYAIKYNSDDIDVEAFAAAIEPILATSVRTSEDETIKNLKNLKTTFEHRYYGNDGQLICDVKITPEDYSE